MNHDQKNVFNENKQSFFIMAGISGIFPFFIGLKGMVLMACFFIIFIFCFTKFKVILRKK
ncbi:hypothetical protein BTA30_01375 [Bacillus swezeyi]|uniref:Uncharacterized protein n=1 Tax=Bacillus swezeyi TaxID=1925020 RepID=A0A1R1S3W7_9BACI|nr:hypothetical protein BW143_04160 [Bacillus swezeyi]OMI32879.1 hypothetical protein BTA30_01375 [Bacillus swezeyi]